MDRYRAADLPYLSMTQLATSCESSCVNKEVKIFSRKLSQLVKKYNHADVIAIGKKKGTIHKAWASYEQER
jgi:hypothetical protein